ncbi:MAG: ABC transporter permease [Erysipelotrichaceae bacterium]
MKQFISDIKKYFSYAVYSATSELKGQVSGSYLGWLWWILDPLLFMLVYSFVVLYVFGNKIENFPVFVFIGLTLWNFFQGTVLSNVGVIASYAAVTKKVYIPKFIIVLMTQFVNFIKMLFGLGIIFIALILSGIPITFNVINLLLLLVVFFILTFGVSLICAHIGVYVADFKNVMTVLVRFLFYLSGVFYNLSNFSDPVLKLYNFLCPTGFIITQARDVLMYNKTCDYLMIGYWALIGIVLCIVGVKLMYKYEKDYMKVV